MIQEYLNATKKILDGLYEPDYHDTLHKSEGVCEKIPTLKENCYHDVSPMLKERFLFGGSWENSTHGDWLTPEEMESFWDSNKDKRDERMRMMAEELKAHKENWDNDLQSIEKPEKISVFAASADTYERVYLLWDENKIEPMVYSYDCNGNHHFENLEQYLIAYINDDSLESD